VYEYDNAFTPTPGVGIHVKLRLMPTLLTKDTGGGNLVLAKRWTKDRVEHASEFRPCGAMNTVSDKP